MNFHFSLLFVSSAKEVLYSCICLFISRIIQKKLLDRFSQTSAERWHMGKEEMIRFGGNPDRVTLGLGLTRYAWVCLLCYLRFI